MGDFLLSAGGKKMDMRKRLGELRLAVAQARADLNAARFELETRKSLMVTEGRLYHFLRQKRLAATPEIEEQALCVLCESERRRLLEAENALEMAQAEYDAALVELALTDPLEDEYFDEF